MTMNVMGGNGSSSSSSFSTDREACHFLLLLCYDVIASLVEPSTIAKKRQEFLDGFQRGLRPKTLLCQGSII